MSDPSGITATPVSSVGPNVICSGVPPVNRWRQRCEIPCTNTLKYIQAPSWDHAADVHTPGGPTCRPAELPSNGTRRHGLNPPLSISTISTHLRSGEAYE